MTHRDLCLSHEWVRGVLLLEEAFLKYIQRKSMSPSESQLERSHTVEKKKKNLCKDDLTWNKGHKHTQRWSLAPASLCLTPRLSVGYVELNDLMDKFPQILCPY